MYAAEEIIDMLGTQNLSQKQIEIVKKQVHQEENRATIQTLLLAVSWLWSWEKA